MNVLFLFRSAGPSYVSRGWEKVLTAAGHRVGYWHKDREGTLDAFRRFEPDLFVGTTWDADEALLKATKARPGMRVVLYAGTWGPVADELDPAEYPIVRCTEPQKRFLERFKRETGRPDLVWLHLTPSWVEPVLGGYRTIGIDPAGITNGADLYTYLGGECRPEYECDVAFVGGKWSYKSKTIDPFVCPLLHPDHPARLRCKVWGHMGWSQQNYLGYLDEGEAKHVFRSAAVCPSIGEPHSFIFSDLVERLYKVPAAGGCTVVGPEAGLDEEFGPGVIPAGKTPAEYQAVIVALARDRELGDRVAAAQRAVVLSGHSYHDRVARLFDLLGLPAEAARVRAVKRELLRDEVTL